MSNKSIRIASELVRLARSLVARRLTQDEFIEVKRKYLPIIQKSLDDAWECFLSKRDSLADKYGDGIRSYDQKPSIDIVKKLLGGGNYIAVALYLSNSIQYNAIALTVQTKDIDETTRHELAHLVRSKSSIKAPSSRQSHDRIFNEISKEFEGNMNAHATKWESWTKPRQSHSKEYRWYQAIKYIIRNCYRIPAGMLKYVVDIQPDKLSLEGGTIECRFAVAYPAYFTYDHEPVRSVWTYLDSETADFTLHVDESLTDISIPYYSKGMNLNSRQENVFMNRFREVERKLIEDGEIKKPCVF